MYKRQAVGTQACEVRGQIGPDFRTVLCDFRDAVEHAEGGNNVLLCNQAGEGGDGALPATEAERREQEGDCGANGGEQGVVVVLHHAELIGCLLYTSFDLLEKGDLFLEQYCSGEDDLFTAELGFGNLIDPAMAKFCPCPETPEP